MRSHLLKPDAAPRGYYSIYCKAQAKGIFIINILREHVRNSHWWWHNAITMTRSGLRTVWSGECFCCRSKHGRDRECLLFNIVQTRRRAGPGPWHTRHPHYARIHPALTQSGHGGPTVRTRGHDPGVGDILYLVIAFLVSPLTDEGEDGGHGGQPPAQDGGQPAPAGGGPEGERAPAWGRGAGGRDQRARAQCRGQHLPYRGLPHRVPRVAAAGGLSSVWDNWTLDHNAANTPSPKFSLVVAFSWWKVPTITRIY